MSSSVITKRYEQNMFFDRMQLYDGKLFCWLRNGIGARNHFNKRKAEKSFRIPLRCFASFGTFCNSVSF